MIKFKAQILPFVFFLTALTAFSQRVQKPKNISEALVILALECPDSVKAKISKTPNEELFNLCYPNGDDLTLIFDWFDVKNGNSRLEKYFAKNGIDYFDHMANVLLLAYKKTLRNEPCTESELLQPYQAIEYKWAQEDSVRFTTATCAANPLNLKHKSKCIRITGKRLVKRIEIKNSFFLSVG